MRFIDKPISSRYLTQDDRIEIADGLAAGKPVKEIAECIGKTFQSVYREISRNRKPDGTYQPWYAHPRGLSTSPATENPQADR
ncbi:helix-turn-helix domain-containing protein [Mycobacterium sp. NAZ190054]|uniref:helix-turn-helix domain-containing protein n=1 Tax=Mycobacterium sp. NAZ190054 TaxID=1747766 RepID=UPI0018D22DB6|nr:helix-turn-helix domain-containing protein [Mycobacterium sp. NAZ190054]